MARARKAAGAAAGPRPRALGAICTSGRDRGGADHPELPRQALVDAAGAERHGGLLLAVLAPVLLPVRGGRLVVRGGGAVLIPVSSRLRGLGSARGGSVVVCSATTSDESSFPNPMNTRASTAKQTSPNIPKTIAYTRLDWTLCSSGFRPPAEVDASRAVAEPTLHVRPHPVGPHGGGGRGRLGPGPALALPPYDTSRSDTADARFGGHRQRQSVLPGRAASVAWSESSDPKKILTSRRQAWTFDQNDRGPELKSSNSHKLKTCMGAQSVPNRHWR